MDETVITPSVPADVPDWNTISRDILCPLCDYNLRGLIEPRCPECGYQFNWTDLLDAHQREHEWLFEDGTRHRLRRFIRTFRTSHFPRRFWSQVKPTQIPNARRLLLYWIILTLFLTVPIVGVTGYRVANVYWNKYQERQQVLSYATNNPRSAAQFARYGGVQGYLNLMAAYPPLWETIADSFGQDRAFFDIVRSIIVAHIAWPWLTVLSLLVFRQTMHRTKIKTVHVMRCAIYSSDVMIVMAMLLLPVLTWRSEFHGYDWFHSPLATMMPLFDPISLLALGLALLVLGYRLWIAASRYLCFPDAAATCAASQLMVTLMFAAMYLYFGGRW